MIAWLAGAALAGDVSLAVGAAVSVPAPAVTWAARLDFGLLAGHDLGLAPARFEVGLSTTTQPREGTPDVAVWGSRTSLDVLGGLGAPLTEGRWAAFGVDALAGPSLLFRRTVTQTGGRSDRATAIDPRAMVSVGPWLTLGPVRLGARAQGYLPIAPQWSAVGTLGVAW